MAQFICTIPVDLTAGDISRVVEDNDVPDTWLAVDSYYGPITEDDYYYQAQYSFADFKYLEINQSPMEVGLI